MCSVCLCVCGCVFLYLSFFVCIKRHTNFNIVQHKYLNLTWLTSSNSLFLLLRWKTRSHSPYTHFWFVSPICKNFAVPSLNVLTFPHSSFMLYIVAWSQNSTNEEASVGGILLRSFIGHQLGTTSHGCFTPLNQVRLLVVERWQESLPADALGVVWTPILRLREGRDSWSLALPKRRISERSHQRGLMAAYATFQLACSRGGDLSWEATLPFGTAWIVNTIPSTCHLLAVSSPCSLSACQRGLLCRLGRGYKQVGSTAGGSPFHLRWRWCSCSWPLSGGTGFKTLRAWFSFFPTPQAHRFS